VTARGITTAALMIKLIPFRAFNCHLVTESHGSADQDCADLGCIRPR